MASAPLFPSKPRPDANNQAGDLAPSQGAFSTAMRRGLGALFLHPVPLYVAPPDDDYLGAYGPITGVQDVPLYRQLGYDGELPGAVQPTIASPLPWTTGG